MNAGRYRDATLRLRDGRSLAYTWRGDEDAQPIVWFDGTPGSRLTTALDDAACDRLGIQVVTFDRPGYGDSDRHPGRSVADVTQDVSQLTADVGWSRWVAVGYSGGAPHALACGARLAERVAAVVAVAAVGPPEEVPGWSGVASDPEHRTMFARSLREALRIGHHGWYDDEVAYHRPWGFRLSDITIPVHFLHGIDDPIAPIDVMRLMVAGIPDATADERPEVGHVAILDQLDRIGRVVTNHLPRPHKETF